MPEPDHRISQCGVENLVIRAAWTPVEKTYEKKIGGDWFWGGQTWDWFNGETRQVTDTIDPLNHRSWGLEINSVRDSWVRDVVVRDCYNNGVKSGRCSYITIQDSQVHNPDGKYYESARYVARAGFNISGDYTLIQRCHTDGCRHNFNYTVGLPPKVILDCTSVNDHGAGGSHQRYMHGLLYDRSTAAMQSGSRGGGYWRDMNVVYWNHGVEKTPLVVSTPPLYCPPTGYKWGIGCYDNDPYQTDRTWWRYKGPIVLGKGPLAGRAVWDSVGRPVEPSSLYEAQLRERLGPQAVKNNRMQVNYKTAAATYWRPEPLEADRRLNEDIFVTPHYNPVRYVKVDPHCCELRYKPADGHRMPDFSKAGYKNGAGEIPMTEAKIILTPSPGSKDDTSRIQAAIDKVSKMPKDPNNMRGAVLLAGGRFNVHGTLNLSADGVVLRGDGYIYGRSAVLAAPSGAGMPDTVMIRMSVASDCGIENIYLLSGKRPAFTSKKIGKFERKYTMAKGEKDNPDHAGRAIEINGVRDCWVRNAVAFGFYKTGISVEKADGLTIKDVRLPLLMGDAYDGFDMKRIGYHLESGDVLVFRSSSANYHLGFSVGRGPGAKAYVDCRSNDAMRNGERLCPDGNGFLYDNVIGNIAPAEVSGPDKGQTGVYWNSACRDLKVTPVDPDEDRGVTWAAGCFRHLDAVPQKGDKPYGPDVSRVIWISPALTVDPRSLYEKQLEDRHGWQAVQALRDELNWMQWNKIISQQQANLAPKQPILSPKELSAQMSGWNKVAADNCGVKGEYPHVTNFKWSDDKRRGAPDDAGKMFTGRVRGGVIKINYKNLKASKKYRLVTYIFDRYSQKIEIDGAKRYYCRNDKPRRPCIHVLDVPAEVYADDGEIAVVVESYGQMRHPYVNGVELWEK